MNEQLQKRLISYALLHMRGEIYRLQQEILEHKAMLVEFPGCALSELSVRMGRFRSPAFEAEQTAQFLADAQGRLAQLMIDYEETQARWQEVQDHNTRELVRAFWERPGGI